MARDILQQFEGPLVAGEDIARSCPGSDALVTLRFGQDEGGHAAPRREDGVIELALEIRVPPDAQPLRWEHGQVDEDPFAFVHHREIEIIDTAELAGLRWSPHAREYVPVGKGADVFIVEVDGVPALLRQPGSQTGPGPLAMRSPKVGDRLQVAVEMCEWDSFEYDWSALPDQIREHITRELPVTGTWGPQYVISEKCASPSGQWHWLADTFWRDIDMMKLLDGHHVLVQVAGVFPKGT